MNRFQSIISILLLLVFSIEVKAQTLDKILNALTICPNKKAIAKDSMVYPAKIILTPVVTFAPETNLSFGLGMKGLFKLRNCGPETRTSNIPLSVQYTVENKYFFFSGFDIFFPKENYRLSGNIRVQSFPSLYFGIGQDTPKKNEEKFAYSQVLLEPIFLKKVFSPYLFLGTGIRFNHISSVEPKPGGLLETSKQSGASGSTSLGLQLAVIYDSRDNVLNAHEGLYAAFTHGFYEKELVGTQAFQLTRLDVRYYTKPFKRKNSILAFHFITHITNGNAPLLELGRLGGNMIMRGYFEGRYTERHLMAGQVEWRQKLNHRWGVVGFAGLGGVAPNLNQFQAKYFRPSAGFGVRFLVDPAEDLNLRLDFGFGQEKFSYYLKIAESF